MLTREEIYKLPKAELHLHLDGSIRPETLLDLARDQGHDLSALASDVGFDCPSSDVDAVREAMKVEDVADLNEYLARFQLTIGLLQNAEAIERVAYEEALDQATVSGCTYVEIRYASLLSTRAGLTQEAVLLAIASGLARAEREVGIVGRVINCCLCHNTSAEAVQEATVAARLVGSGVVGFDRAGGEGVPFGGEPGTRPAVHAEAFRIARSAGLGITCHAGEPDHVGPEQIKSAILDCGATRIGHGLTARHDRSLRQYMRAHRILVEVNLTSNRQTRSVGAIANHPVKQLVADGVPVALCADNNLLAGVSLLDEYMIAQDVLGFTEAQLELVALDSLRYSFVEDQIKHRLVAQAQQAIALRRSQRQKVLVRGTDSRVV
jgi:adenosine deaminase